MADYKQIALKYCREKVLPRGYVISDDLRRKRITLVEDAAVNYNEFATGFDTDSEAAEIIKEKNLKLTKKQKGRLKNLLEQ